MNARCLVAAVGLILVSCDRFQGSADQTEEEVIETVHLTADNFDSFIATGDKVVAVMFHAGWCGPCKEMGPTVESVVGEFGGKMMLGKVDVDDEGTLAKSLGVVGIPDVRLYRGGIMVDAMKGAIPKREVRNHFRIQVEQLEPGAGDESGPAQAPITPMSEDWLPPGVERK